MNFSDLKINNFILENDYTYSIITEDNVYYLNYDKNELKEQDGNNIIKLTENEKDFIVFKCTEDLPF